MPHPLWVLQASVAYINNFLIILFLYLPLCRVLCFEYIWWRTEGLRSNILPSHHISARKKGVGKNTRQATIKKINIRPWLRNSWIRNKGALSGPICKWFITVNCGRLLIYQSHLFTSWPYPMDSVITKQQNVPSLSSAFRWPQFSLEWTRITSTG